MIIQLTNGVPSSNQILESNFRQLFPDTSFPKILTPEVLEPYGYGIYQVKPAPDVGRYEKAVEGTPIKNSSGVWEQTWTIEPMTAEEQSIVDAKKASEVRYERNLRLAATDWRVTFEVEKAAIDGLGIQFPTVWATYRQALRDVPSQPGFPWDITWPTEPS